MQTGWDAVAAGPRLSWVALRRVVLPAGWSTFETLRHEGSKELHWKVLGDALVRFLRHGGPVHTKLGQILAAREDLLPRTVCRRLASLYTNQTPMSRAEVERGLRRCFGRTSPFESFSWRPLAVGSIGQVHRAKLLDDSDVVVKLVRPGVERAIQRDMNALRVTAEIALQLARVSARTRERTRSALDTLGDALALEANLEHEANALEEFGRRLARNPRVRVPRCFREHCSRDLLVIEELRGEPLAALLDRAHDDDDFDPEHKDERKETARRAAHLALSEILSQVFEDGRFHADPHGGNLLLLEDGRLGLIDLGLTGELQASDRANLARAVRAFLARDLYGATRALLAFGTTPPDFDLVAFQCDAATAFENAQGDARPERLEVLVNDLLRIAHRHGIYLPHSTTLLIKTLVTIEGVARSLDPEINVVLAALPVVVRSLRPRWLRFGRRRKSGA